MSELLVLLSGMVEQNRSPIPAWSSQEWERTMKQARSLCETEPSTRVLGDALRFDEGLELPVDIVIAIYRRLMTLGIADVRTRVCFARYLLLHGPEWDEEANSELAAVEDVAREAGLWDSPHLGHHPVFFSDV